VSSVLWHYDLEEQETLNRFEGNPAQFIADAVAQNKNVVVTCGFAPDNEPSVAAVLRFRDAGFKWIWFDGNRGAALKMFEARTKSKSRSDAEYYRRMHEFYLQMYRIENSKVVERFQPTIINPFDGNWKFKLADRLLDEIKRA